MAGAITSPQLHVTGTKILEPNGVEFRIHGVNICGMEWSAVGDHLQESVPVALDQWHANFIRLPLSQDRWFGKAPDNKDDGSSYRALVDWVVNEIERRGKYVLLDLHWSDCNQWGQNIGQHALPDSHSLQFWKSCAARYANRPAVFFDLYNEPYGDSWDTWRNGGPVTENVNGQKITYQAVGFQTLIEAIRGVGAKNIVLAGGLGYASRLDGILGHPLHDVGGHGIVYADHFYPGWGSIEDWEPMITEAHKQLPIIVGEFGADRGINPLDDANRRVIDVLNILHKLDMNWVAWCLHPAAHSCLITDWTYRKSPDFGQYVYDAINGIPLPKPVRVKTAADADVFDGKLENQFQSWLQDGVSFNGDVCNVGKPSISVEISNYSGLQLGAMPFDGAPFRSIALWLNGGDTGGQHLKVVGMYLGPKGKDMEAGSFELPALVAGTWTRVEVPFEKLDIADNDHVKSFSIRSASGPNQPRFYVDDVKLIGRKE